MSSNSPIDISGGNLLFKKPLRHIVSAYHKLLAQRKQDEKAQLKLAPEDRGPFSLNKAFFESFSRQVINPLTELEIEAEKLGVVFELPADIQRDDLIEIIHNEPLFMIIFIEKESWMCRLAGISKGLRPSKLDEQYGNHKQAILKINYSEGDQRKLEAGYYRFEKKGLARPYNRYHLALQNVAHCQGKIQKYLEKNQHSPDLLRLERKTLLTGMMKRLDLISGEVDKKESDAIMASEEYHKAFETQEHLSLRKLKMDKFRATPPLNQQIFNLSKLIDSENKSLVAHHKNLKGLWKEVRGQDTQVITLLKDIHVAYIEAQKCRDAYIDAESHLEEQGDDLGLGFSSLRSYPSF